MLRHLGGWTRLWIVLSAIWLVLLLTVVVPEILAPQFDITQPYTDVATGRTFPGMDPALLSWSARNPRANALLLWLVPVATAYVAGMVFRWVREGFRRKA